MSERDKDQGTPADNDFEPGEEDFEEEPEEGFEGEGATDESAEAEYREEAGEPSRRRFGFGRAAQEPEEAARRPVGSVRESHERVHIDDRLSIIYALLASGVLIGLLVLAMAAQFVPQPVPPTAPPIVVPTFQATPSPSAGPSASVSLAPSPSPVPSASPVPTASPVSSAS